MCIRAVADIRSPCNREIRSGRLADKLRHIRRQLVAFHLGKCSEENTIDLFKGMHHFSWDRNVTICGTPPPMASRSRIFRGNPAENPFRRASENSGYFRRSSHLPCDRPAEMCKGGRRGWETARKSVLEQSDLFGAVVVQQISNLIQHRLIPVAVVTALTIVVRSLYPQKRLPEAAMTENPDTAEFHSPYRRRKHQKYP